MGYAEYKEKTKKEDFLLAATSMGIGGNAICICYLLRCDRAYDSDCGRGYESRHVFPKNHHINSGSGSQ